MTGHVDPKPQASSPPILSQGLLSMGAYGINTAASFFAIIGIIRLLDKTEWGLFSLAIQIVAFTSMIADFGIGPVILRRLAIAPGRAATILLEATYGRLLLFAPAWLVSCAVGWWLEPDWTFFLILNVMLFNMVISAKVPVLRGTLDAFYRSQSRMGVPALTMALDAVMLLGAVLVIPASFTDPLSAMLVYTASNLLGAVLLFVGGLRLANTLNTEAVSPQWTGMRELIVVSAPLALYQLLNVLPVTIDVFLLKLFHDDVAVGTFTAALRIMTPLAVFPTIVAISAAPHFARASVAEDDGQRARLSRLFSLSVKTLLIGTVVMAGLGLGNTELLLAIAFKGKFDDAALPMALLFVVFLPMSLNIFLVELNNMRGQLRSNTQFAAILATVSVAAGVLLVWQYAAAGAAAAKLVAVTAGLVFLISHSRAGIAVAMKPVVARAAVLLLSLLAVRFLLADLHWLLANAVALLVVAVEVVVLRVYSVEEVSQWKSQLAALVGRGGDGEKGRGGDEEDGSGQGTPAPPCPPKSAEGRRRWKRGQEDPE